MSAKSRTEAWLYGMCVAVVGGVASTGSAWMGLAMAKSVGLEVPNLNWKALGMLLLTSTVSNLFMYLKQSPLPSLSDGSTDFIARAQVQPQSNEKTTVISSTTTPGK